MAAAASTSGVGVGTAADAAADGVRSTSTAWSRSPWTTPAQCGRAPTGSGDCGGFTVDCAVLSVRVHSVFVADTAATKVPPADLDTLLPARFAVWRVAAERCWRRAERASDRGEVDPTDRQYLKRFAKAGDPDPAALAVPLAELAQALAAGGGGGEPEAAGAAGAEAAPPLRAGYITDKPVLEGLHPKRPGVFEFWANASTEAWKGVNPGEKLRIRTLGESIIVEHAERLNAKTILSGNDAGAEKVASGWGAKLVEHAEDSSSDDGGGGGGNGSGAESDEWD